MTDPMTDKDDAEAFFQANGFTEARARGRFGTSRREIITTMGAADPRPRCCNGKFREYDWYQCDRAATKTDAAGRTWCGAHSPAAVAGGKAAQKARSDASMKRWDHERAQRDQEARNRVAFPKLVAALREIAAGHNDPRRVATEALLLLLPAAKAAE